MKSYRSIILLCAAGASLAGLAACSNDTHGYPAEDQKPFMQTDPGTLPVTGKEPALPNNPGYNRDMPASPINDANVQGGPDSPGYRSGGYVP